MPDAEVAADRKRVFIYYSRRRKSGGFLAVDPAMAQKCLAWGANFVAVGVDTMLYTEGAG